jgi:hypothetical protein
MTLSLQYSDRLLSSPASLAGILAVLHACLDFKGTLLGKFHYLLYLLAPAMQPRMLVTLDKYVAASLNLACFLTNGITCVFSGTLSPCQCRCGLGKLWMWSVKQGAPRLSLVLLLIPLLFCSPTSRCTIFSCTRFLLFLALISELHHSAESGASY